MSEATRFLLIRHGESTWNAQRRWQGQADAPLSEVGRRQARALARELARLADEEPVAALYSSDLERAAATARVLGRALGLAPRLDARLRELDVGVFAGHDHAEIAQRWPDAYAEFRSGDERIRVGGGETRAALAQRVGEAIGEIAAAHPGACVAVVTHRGPIRTLLPETRPGNAETCRLVVPAEAPAARSVRARR